jgi:tetratricopeptide (TPR) repeat protein
MPVFDKRNRWIINVILAIASLSLVGIFVVPIFVTALQGSPTSTPSPTASITPGQDDLEAQARGYELVLQRDPDRETALYALRGLIDVRLQQGNLEATVEPLTRLAEMNPDQPEYTVLLGQVQQRLGDREAAAQAYRDVLSTRPGNMDALQGLVNLLLDEGRPEAAIGLIQDTLQTADEANQVQPGSVDVASVQLLLAQIYAEQNRFEEAIAVYDQLIDSNVQDFRPLYGKALILQAQGESEAAQPLFTSAAALAPPQFKDQINQIAAGELPNPLQPGAIAPTEELPAPGGETGDATEAPTSPEAN